MHERDALRHPGGGRAEQLGNGSARPRQRRGVARHQELLPLGRAEHLDAGEGELRRLGDGAEERGQPLPVAFETDRVVQLGVAVHHQRHRGALGVRAERDEQVECRARGQVVAGGAQFTEAERPAVRHEVDDGPQERPRTAVQPELALQVLQPEPLVPERPVDLLGHQRHQPGERGSGGDVHPDRHAVGHHAGYGPRPDAAASRHRQPDDHVPLAGHPVEVGRDRGHEEDLPGGAGRRCGLAQQLDVLRGQRTAPAQPQLLLGQGLCRTGPAGHAKSFRQVPETLQPVRAVPGVIRRGAIGGFLVEQCRQWAEGRLDFTLTACQCRIDFRETPAQQMNSVTVHHHMMYSVVEQETGGVHLQQGVGGHRAVGEVERTADVRPHPAARVALGVGRAGEVDQRQVNGVVGIEDLPQTVVLDHGLDADDLGLGTQSPPGGTQQRDIDPALDPDVLRAVVLLSGRIQLMGEPHPLLTGGQRQPYRVPFDHSRLHRSLIFEKLAPAGRWNNPLRTGSRTVVNGNDHHAERGYRPPIPPSGRAVIGRIAKKYRTGLQGRTGPRSEEKESPMDESRAWTPLVITPAEADAGPAGLIARLRGLDDLTGLLTRSKALVFRGFGVTPAELDEVMDLLLPNRLAYVHGNSPRTKVGRQIYTSTEYPPEQTISMHNEMSYAHQWPTRLLFYCDQAAETGGATPVVDGVRWLRALDPEVRERFAGGVRYTQNLHGGAGFGKSWQDTFETDSRPDVEAFLDGSGADLRVAEGRRPPDQPGAAVDGQASGDRRRGLVQPGRPVACRRSRGRDGRRPPPDHAGA